MASRKIRDLTPKMQRLYSAFKKKMDEAGISFVITCTARTVREQIALYAQGRQSLEEVNALRKIAGLWEITAAENKRKVTWTLHSKHLIDLEDNDESNNQSNAFDIVITKDKKASWDIKVDVNKNDVPDYDEAGSIGESVGLKWGGRFRSPDRPHYELPA